MPLKRSVSLQERKKGSALIIGLGKLRGRLKMELDISRKEHAASFINTSFGWERLLSSAPPLKSLWFKPKCYRRQDEDG